MIINTLTLSSTDYPAPLRTLHKPPATLYHAGAPLTGLMARPRLAIIGTRDVTTYGRRVTEQLAGELAGQGVVIISGLALGVDGIAHHAALEAGGLCVGVLPSPIEQIVPVTHERLAEQILDQGGALVSEYPAGEPPYKQNFIARNRLMSGLADAVLITEAGLKSGAIHTANFALDQGRTVLVVPGSIHYRTYEGSHNLLKSGATLVTSYKDVMYALDLKPHDTPVREVRGRNAYEQRVLDLMLRGLLDGDQLLDQSQLSTTDFNRVLTMLEISGKIRPLGANQWGLV